MSYSSLYVVDTNFHDLVDEEYKNSWLFSPVIWDVLLDKYMYDEIQTPYGYRRSITGFDGTNLIKKLNDIINNCDSFNDRICWELSMQQGFFSKDRNTVAQRIRDFLSENDSYHRTDEGISYLTLEHIKERFEEIASSIENIDEEKYPIFIFKNTSVDDGVELLFNRYDEDKDDYVDMSLSDWKESVLEFVNIDGEEISFTDNLGYFNKK